MTIGIGMTRAIISVTMDVSPFQMPILKIVAIQAAVLSLLSPSFATGVHDAPTRVAMARNCSNVAASVM